MFDNATAKMFVARRQPPDSPIGAEKLLNAMYSLQGKSAKECWYYSGKY